MMSHQLRMSAATQRPPVNTVAKFCKVFFQWKFCHLLGQPRWPPQHGLHELQPEPREPREPRYVVFANVSQLPLKEVLHKLQLQLQRFFLAFWPVFLIFSFFFSCQNGLKAERRHRRPRRRPLGRSVRRQKESLRRQDFQSRFCAVRSLQSRPGSLGASDLTTD